MRLLLDIGPDLFQANCRDKRLTNSQFASDRVLSLECPSDVSDDIRTQLRSVGANVITIAEGDQMVEVDTQRDAAQMVELESGFNASTAAFPDHPVRFLVPTGVVDGSIATVGINGPSPDVAWSNEARVLFFPLHELLARSKGCLDVSRRIKRWVAASAFAQEILHCPRLYRTTFDLVL